MHSILKMDTFEDAERLLSRSPRGLKIMGLAFNRSKPISWIVHSTMRAQRTTSLNEINLEGRIDIFYSNTCSSVNGLLLSYRKKSLSILYGLHTFSIKNIHTFIHSHTYFFTVRLTTFFFAGDFC